MKERIYLIGMPGSGKTTVGRALAEKLNAAFLDTDALIEKEEGRTIVQIFSREGEGYFRKRETEVLHSITETPVVVATGGGIIENKENVDYMRSVGTVIFIDRDIDTIMESVRYDDDRPLLRSKDDLQKLYTRRIKKYQEAAHNTIEHHSNLDETIAKVITSLTEAQSPQSNNKHLPPCSPCLCERKFNLIGYPLGHTLSPAIHSALY
jgi:shikimate kinase